MILLEKKSGIFLQMVQPDNERDYHGQGIEPEVIVLFCISHFVVKKRQMSKVWWPQILHMYRNLLQPPFAFAE